jgi:superfamily II DNA or RNA helicase
MGWRLPLWAHQKAAVRRWAETCPLDSLQILTPGAGKTRLGLAVSVGALDGGLARQILVAVPTRPLKQQWQTNAADADLLLDDEFDGRLRRGARGGIVTYAQILEQPDVLERYVQRAPTLVITDEPHHLGYVSAWGLSALRVFNDSPHRLHLTGTPIRTRKKDRIAFLRYDERTGEAIADSRYDYRDALRDGIVRPLVSYPQGASVRWMGADGKERQATFEDRTLSKKHASERLRAVLWHDGYIAEVITRADQALQGLRRRDPRAAMLVVGMTVRHAERITQIIKDLTGIKPWLILGEDAGADEAIARFRKSNDPYLVAVQKVAEGVDIPRLRLLTYLTNKATELWWRQTNGRIVRIGEVDGPGYVLFPSDPRLLRLAELLAEDVRAAQDIWTPDTPNLAVESSFDIEDEEEEEEEDGDPAAGRVVPLEVKHLPAEAWSIGTADPYALQLTQTETSSADAAAVAAMHERSDSKATYAQLVRQVAARSGNSPHDIHSWWVRKNGHGIDAAPDPEVAERISTMRSWLKNERFPALARPQRQRR